MSRPTRRPTGTARPRRQAGFGLTELMIGLLVGLLVVLAMTTLFVNLGRQDIGNRDLAAMGQSSRNALYLLTHDLANAGFLLKCKSLPGCAQMIHNGSGYHGSGVQSLAYAAPTAGGAITQGTINEGKGSITFNYEPDIATDPLSIRYRIDVSNGVPTLKRARTGIDGNAVESDIAGNVVALAVQFYNGVYSNTLPANNLQSVRLGLLIRTASTDGAYTSPATYTLLDAIGTAPNTAAAITYTVPNRNFRYSLIQQNVYLRNQ